MMSDTSTTTKIRQIAQEALDSYEGVALSYEERTIALERIIELIDSSISTKKEEEK